MATPPLKVIPFSRKFSGMVTVPGSKSITNRLFPLAVLSSKHTGQAVYFSGALKSEDSEIMKEALEKMGAKITEISGKNSEDINTAWEVSAGSFFEDTSDYEIFCGNSGTTIRFLTALCALRKGKTLLTGVERMKARPIGDLVSAIEQLGAEVKFLENSGFPPLEITPIQNWENATETKKISLSGNLSSQFFTALFHIASMFGAGAEISVEGELVSKPYIDMTLNILRKFGVRVENSEYKIFKIPHQKFHASENFLIEGDASGASYPLSIGLITGGKVEISNLKNLKNSIQGDAKFSKLVLEKMKPENFPENSSLKPLGKINLEDIPDVAMTAVVMCAYADGISEISGLSTLRHKECDRIFALESNLQKMGIRVESTDDTMTIWGNPEKIHGAEIECFGDHRVAMCFAVLGTVVPNVVILDPDCVQKTYPSFWKDLENWRG